jgi:UTP-glucose-1-phosphate uridylyltransferase
MDDVVAIIPAAGKGTRMASVTRGAPKELLPLGRGTVLGRIVLEALASADRVVVVNSRTKPGINAFVETLHNPRVAIAYQEEPRGLLDAICHAQVDDDVIVLLGDTVFRGHSPIERMRDLLDKAIDGCVAVEPVATDFMDQYGIVEIDESHGAVTRILEKPKCYETSSRWAIAARYAFSRRLMAFLNEQCGQCSQNPGEIGLTEGLNAAVQNGFDIKAVAIQPDQERIDCGSAVEYRNAQEIHWD